MNALDRPCPICGAPAGSRCRQAREELQGEPQVPLDYDPAVTMAGIHLARAVENFDPQGVILAQPSPPPEPGEPAELIVWAVPAYAPPLDLWS